MRIMHTKSDRVSDCCSICNDSSDNDSDSKLITQTDIGIDILINAAPVMDEHIPSEMLFIVNFRNPSESSTETPTETFEVFLEKKRGSFGLNVTVCLYWILK